MEQHEFGQLGRSAVFPRNMVWKVSIDGIESLALTGRPVRYGNIVQRLTSVSKPVNFDAFDFAAVAALR